MKDLLEKFTEHNRRYRLSSPKKFTLLAVSGGLDSVVMCHLYAAAGFPFGIMHANFQLRGEESAGDEQFVKSLAQQYGVPCFTKKFDTLSYAREHHLSVQAAARALRYEWFETLRSEHAAAHKRTVLIATAHHLNDNIETLLLYFIKGPTLKGLRGIPVRSGHIVRPLLFATRDEIEAYAHHHHLAYRHDSSNDDDKYIRNKIRHHIIPALKEINPGLESTLASKLDLLGEIERQFDQKHKRIQRQLFLTRGTEVFIPIRKLQKTPNAAMHLYEFLSQYDFTTAQVEDVLQSIGSPPGRQFLTAKARLIKDRRFFILTPHTTPTLASHHYVESIPAELQLENATLSLHYTDAAAWTTQHPNEKNIAYVDASGLQFPLLVRHWQPGDYFYPLGMNMKKKKLKKFFSDEKIPLHQKEKIWIVESNRRIVWVAGHRIDERFKCSHKTKQAVCLKIKNETTP
ncbi:MAG: tRNA lysidine(34) synthetase TilS [Chitinophagales bacterium]|nr:tRNA lysidine(34) synthetase TilS [Chitinophagales bacterium]MDW8418930.1 tRNA lysidine(34) synthetase TilS [Chitinophagales bacterium]